MEIESKDKIIQSNDDNLLNEINLLLGLSEEDFLEDISEEVKQAINRAKTQLDRGEGIAPEQISAELRTRFLNEQCFV